MMVWTLTLISIADMKMSMISLFVPLVFPFTFRYASSLLQGSVIPISELKMVMV